MKSAEKLFDLLHDSDAAMMTVVPRDADGKSLGVIVIVRDELAQPFLEYIEAFEPKTAALSVEDYGWERDE